MTAYVLFVDDDVSNLIVWEAACSELFPVLTASNADQALYQMHSHEVAVVLSDLRMPGRSGIQLLEEVRREFPAAIRMLITAHSELGVAVDAINRSGVRRFLQKPCTIQDLRAEVSEAMDLYALRIHARSVERRLMLTERIYTLGLVAGGLNRPDRSAMLIRDSMNRAREEVHAIVANVDPGVGQAATLRRELDALEERLTASLLQVERVMELTVSEGGQPKTSDDQPRVDVAAVLHLALSIARSDVGYSADLALDLREVPLARGESRKLSQVVLSLLVNASEAVSSLPQAQRAITVRLNTESDHVCLDVIDSGPSIESDDLPNLFDPLRGGGTSRRGGLGLAISKALVEEMGGELRVQQPQPGGAAFRVVLPAA